MLSEKSITLFSFRVSDNPGLVSEVQGTSTADEIHFTLPTGSSVTALKPAIEHTGISITPASNVAKDFTNPVNYTVKAQDGSTKMYVISVSVTSPVLSSDKTITSFSFS